MHIENNRAAEHNPINGEPCVEQLQRPGVTEYL